MSVHMMGSRPRTRQRLTARADTRTRYRGMIRQLTQEERLKQDRINRLSELHVASREEAREAAAAAAALRGRWYVRWGLAIERWVARVTRRGR